MSKSKEWEENIDFVIADVDSYETIEDWRKEINRNATMMLRCQIEIDGVSLDIALSNYKTRVSWFLSPQTIEQTYQLAFNKYNPRGSYEQSSTQGAPAPRI